MPRIFVGNFDFEHELAEGRPNQSSNVRDISADLASAWVTVAETDDLIWSPGGVPTFDFHEFFALSGIQPRFVPHERELPRGPDWELVPWGWTASVLKWGQQLGWTCPAPPLDVVRRVNSRVFRWELESRLEVALPESAVLTSLDRVVAHIERFGSRDESAGWILKADFGMSGRERQLGRGSVLTTPTLNWAKRRLQQSSALVFEPWLDRVAEAGIQIEIPQEGDPRLLGVLPLLTDPTGTYRGSRIPCSEGSINDWKTAIEVALRVASELQRVGYWGPLGIDAMQYRDRDGALRIRPLQDLNARFTMGRLGLGLRRFMAPGCDADWLHDARLVASEHVEDSTSTVVQITERSWLIRQP